MNELIDHSLDVTQGDIYYSLLLNTRDLYIIFIIIIVIIELNKATHTGGGAQRRRTTE